MVLPLEHAQRVNTSVYTAEISAVKDPSTAPRDHLSASPLNSVNSNEVIEQRASLSLEK